MVKKIKSELWEKFQLYLFIVISVGGIAKTNGVFLPGICVPSKQIIEDMLTQLFHYIYNNI